MIYGESSEELIRLNRFAKAFVIAASHGDARRVPGAARFPHGLCSWASYAGGVLLMEAGLGSWTLWNAGTRDGWPFHDWLVRDDMYVDLTAHQFPGYVEPLVGAGTNPLSERYSRPILTKPPSLIVEHPPILEWKFVVADLMDRGALG